MPVRHPRGYIHGFLAVRDAADSLIGSGDVIQRVAGNRITNSMMLNFRDGSLYHETAVFSQRRTYQLLSYKLIQKGPSFKSPGTFTFDRSSGNVVIDYTDEKQNRKHIFEHMDLPDDLANGLIPTLLTDIDPKVETTLSMLLSTPKPRLVKLKISTVEPDSFRVAGVAAQATHYVIKIDIGGVTGVAAKVLGKQPPPEHVWVAAGNAPIFLRSMGALYEDGPIWQIELTSPNWPERAKARTEE
ncbi:MAG: hypothetical protein U0Q18_12045 [Bryobacteraceae bacterium]